MDLFREATSVEVWRNVAVRTWAFLPQLAAGIAVFLLFWLGAFVACRIIRRVGPMSGIDDGLNRLLARSAKIRPSATFTSDRPCSNPSFTPLSYTCERLNYRVGKSKPALHLHKTRCGLCVFYWRTR